MNYNSYFGQPAGVNPTQAAMQGVKVNSWLSPETINQLRKDTEQFNLAVTEEEVARAQCNHRNNDTTSSLVPSEDGGVTCTICGYHFAVTEELEDAHVQAATDLIENILQTSKIMYMSLDSSLGKQFFQIIAFIRKIPKLYRIASNDYKKYASVQGYTQDIPQNAFAIFGALTNPNVGYAFNNQQYTGQPGMNYGFQPQPNAGGYGYGAQQPNMGMGTVPPQPQPGMNPFYGAPSYNPGYQQQYYQPTPTPNQGFAMNPQGAAAPAPQAPNANQTAPVAPDTKSDVTVDGQFKG